MRKLLGSLSALIGVGVLSCAASTAAPAPPPASPSPQALAARIIETTGVRGGLVVHLGCGDGRLTVALRASDAYLVQGLDADPRNVAAAREHARTLKLCGKVSFDHHAGGPLPYVDNLVNLLVVDAASGISQTELMRVLAPEGVAYIKTGSHWQKIAKPRPKGLDEWNQYLHDSGNNAVAHDEAVGPPRHMQWLAGPNWSRHHDHMASLSAMVSAAGRVFYIMDEGPREAILLPPQWMLVARDAFSGTLLWKRPIAEWNTHLWPLKSGPNQLPRRLVAVGDRVYVTLGIDAPLTALDAATGQTVRTFEGTDHTDEIIAREGVLYLLKANQPNKWKDYRPKHTYVWDNTRRANSEWAWDQAERSVMAVQAETGKTLWKRESRVAPLTLAADADRVYLYDGEKVVALGRADGQPQWAAEPVVRKTPFPTGYGPTLVVCDGVVLLSVEQNAMTAFAANDGHTLWKAPHHRGGHMSPDDMLVINGLVWSGAVANGADSGVFTGRDLKTGEIQSEFPPDVKPDWFHHRCYRSRATDRYFIASRTGIEFIDLAAKHWDFNHWVRGGCLYGFMPANGLLYVPPHSCGCFLESKMFGLSALAADGPTRRAPRDVPDDKRLERGPAAADPLAAEAASAAADWPTYRHDAMRSAATATAVPVALKRSWETPLGGKLSSVTVAEGKVFVAAVDAHTLHALDAETGQPAWRRTVGARIDSPPTVFRGRVIFGSADGWVYCLRSADGELAWRFRAAPDLRRQVAYEQVESVWPVSGSVLVERGAVWCVAGRSAFLDGGLRLLRLDPASGRKLSETILDDRDPATGENLQSLIRGQDMPVALPDILSSDGRSAYMRTQAFDLEGNPRMAAPLKMGSFARRRAAPPPEVPEEIGPHLFSRTGFLDDSFFFRSYWMFGREVDSNYGGWLRPGHFAPCGRLMAFNDNRIFGFDRKPEYLCNASVQEYYLYGADREVAEGAVERVQAAARRIDAASPQKSATSSDWALRKRYPLTDQNVATFHWAAGTPAMQARGLVLAGDTLFVAGPPDLLDEEQAFRNYDDPAVQRQLKEQTEALAGRRGAKLLALSAADGKLQAAFELAAMPTFDGMAAAGGKLFYSTLDGKVVCLGPRGADLPAAQGVSLVPLDTQVKEPPPEAAPPATESLSKEFSRLVQAEVTKCELGYRVAAQGKKTAFALKKLAEPASGKFRLSAKMKITEAGELKNGFLVFGDRADDASLVKCGLRMALKKAVITQGASSGSKTAEQPLEIEADKTYEVRVTVDLASGEVAMQVGETTVKAKLDPVPQRVSFVGYGTISAVTEFSAYEIQAE